GDGIITSGEVTLAPTFSYLGTPFPTQGASLNTGVSWKDRLRLQVTLDYRAGMSLYNLTAEFRCRQGNCPELVDPSVPLADQARAVAAVFKGDRIGHTRDADVLTVRQSPLTHT